MPVRQKDAQRALELLQQYRAKLDQRQQGLDRVKHGGVEEDQQLQQSLDRVINVFQSQLFSALLDIQEFYELTLMADSKASMPPSNSPEKRSASSDPPPERPQTPTEPSAEQSPSKPLTAKPRSFKYPAPPVPPGGSPVKPLSRQSSTSQSGKIKYRAPLPPVQTGSPQPSSPAAGESAPTEVSPNGTKAPAASSPQPSSEHSMTTVSALVSGTIQGLVSPSAPHQLSPTGARTLAASPGHNRVTAAALSTGKEAGTVTPGLSPTSPNQGKFLFPSPTNPPATPSKRSRLSPTSPGPRQVSPVSPGRPPVPLTPVKVRPCCYSAEVLDSR